MMSSQNPQIMTRSDRLCVLHIYEALLRSNPENTYFLVSSTVPFTRLGDLDPNRQKTYFERALKILKDLDAAGRLEPGRKGSIAWLESRLGRQVNLRS